jgi:hypothetical protein
MFVLAMRCTEIGMRPMRKPTTIEHLYLDFDGFFASVEQLRDPSLRGRPVGVVPYIGGRSTIIAASREAKARGVKSIMGVEEARALCRDLVLVHQKPDLYRRAHNALVSEIGSVIPVDQVKSIDELSCWLDLDQRSAPTDLAERIKRTIRYNIGATLTCSIGMAANRHLAKIASDTRKPDGLAIWHPEDAAKQLAQLKLDDIPGVGRSMLKRLTRVGVVTVPGLMALQPKHVRALWRNITGERLWYALHGYAIESPKRRALCMAMPACCRPMHAASLTRAKWAGCCSSRRHAGCVGPVSMPRRYSSGSRAMSGGGVTCGLWVKSATIWRSCASMRGPGTSWQCWCRTEPKSCASV